MGSLLNHPAALSAQGLVQSSAAKANCIQPGPGAISSIAVARDYLNRRFALLSQNLTQQK